MPSGTNRRPSPRARYSTLVNLDRGQPWIEPVGVGIGRTLAVVSYSRGSCDALSVTGGAAGVSVYSPLGVLDPDGTGGRAVARTISMTLPQIIVD